MKLPNFSLNFQKIILYQSINYCLDRVKESHDYIFLKFQFWVLKLMNKNIASTGEFNPVGPISSEELKESLEILSKEVEKIESKKKLLLKVAYELGTYYYLTNDYNRMKYYYELCIANYGAGSTNMYFNPESLIKLLNLINNEPYWLTHKEPESDIEMNDRLNLSTMPGIPENYFNTAPKENDFATLFQKISINSQDKAIIEVYMS